MREIDKIIPIVAQLVQEGSGDARAHGRKALYVLYSTNPTELEKVLFIYFFDLRFAQDLCNLCSRSFFKQYVAIEESVLGFVTA